MALKNQIDVRATATLEQIDLSVTHNYNDTSTELYHGVLRLQEQKVRDALKSLGWTPPDEMRRVTGIVQCGKCGGVFTGNLNMSQRCPDCGGALTYGCTAETFVNSFADAQTLDLVFQEDSDLIWNTMSALGYHYDPDATGQDRLTIMEEN